MGFPSINKNEELFYQELVKAGYPNDRISREFQLDDYRPGFAILPPGLAQYPMLVYEVKNDLQTGMEWGNGAIAAKLRKRFAFPILVYCSAEQVLIDVDTANAMKTQSFLPTYEALKQKWLTDRTFISSLILENFMSFKSADFHFGSKLNVIIGENGSGKTQLLKLIYTIARSLAYEPEEKAVKIDFSRFAIREVFGANKFEEFITGSKKNNSNEALVRFALSGQKEYETLSIKDKIVISGSARKMSNTTLYDKGTAVFLPTHELLSIFPGFNYLRQVYQGKWPYDQTYSDSVTYLGLPIIESQKVFSKAIIQEVEKGISGHIYLNEQGTRFLMQMKRSRAIYEIPMVAEGWRKIGQLLQLINTGAIHPGSILLWDEPEANLNPRLICLIAKVIVELSKSGIQVFVTTHSLFFLRELSMLIKSKKTPADSFEKGEVRFFNFVENGRVEQGDDEVELGSVLLLDESLRQSDRYLLEDY